MVGNGRAVFDESTPITTYDGLFDGVQPLPLLNRNDLDLLFDYLLFHSLNSVKLKAEWDRASSAHEHELFLSSLARVVGRRGMPLLIVRTKENVRTTSTAMASRSVNNTTAREMASSSLFTNTSNAFSERDATHGLGMNASLPNPNASAPINDENDGGDCARPPENGDDAPSSGSTNRPSNGLCNFHKTEYAINQRYRYNSAYHKSLRTLQQTIGEKKRPCLFDAARIFGGSQCSQEVFNGICSFHWSMLNLRVGVCERYNTHARTDGTFQHYEMLVDVAIPDRALVPIFPNVNDRTSIWDLMFGFTYATNRGLLTTKINEGAAMAYALFYMMDNRCYVEFLARSTYWVQNMTEYLMAFVFYNDELSKDVYASRFPDVTCDANNVHAQSVLKNIFTKNVYTQDLSFDIDIPKIELPTGMDLLHEKDAHLVSNMPPLSNGAAGLQTAPAVLSKHDSVDYKTFHIFTAPLILSLRPSSYVNDMFLYAAPPVVGVFNMKFRGSPQPGHSVFAIQGPVQYGVTLARGNRNLPFAADMPVCTQAYVATLGSSSNVDVNEDRIFAAELARFADFTIPDSDTLFTLNGLR
ncbi:hypothetical protein J6590_097970 [Homalodisca vitripennis]|nr:hypothetical protein J6590_088231 [Homalodisca vitripennis]KAG8319138.1 hypothetical protein J6590_097970 [Homalodisca vitripennis]